MITFIKYVYYLLNKCIFGVLILLLVLSPHILLVTISKDNRQLANIISFIMIYYTPAVVVFIKHMVTNTPITERPYWEPFYYGENSFVEEIFSIKNVLLGIGLVMFFVLYEFVGDFIDIGPTREFKEVLFMRHIILCFFTAVIFSLRHNKN